MGPDARTRRVDETSVRSSSIEELERGELRRIDARHAHLDNRDQSTGGRRSAADAIAARAGGKGVQRDQSVRRAAVTTADVLRSASRLIRALILPQRSMGVGDSKIRSTDGARRTW